MFSVEPSSSESSSGALLTVSLEYGPYDSARAGQSLVKTRNASDIPFPSELPSWKQPENPKVAVRFACSRLINVAAESRWLVFRMSLLYCLLLLSLWFNTVWFYLR